MGTGKSTVGRLVAARLQRPFVDMDGLIEQRERRTTPAIFAEEGEVCFRQREAELCRELAERRGLIIATGSGRLVPEQNLHIMEQSGRVICLDCEPAVLWQRISHSNSRPMLAGQDERRFARLAGLLVERTPANARITYHIDVTHLLSAQVAERVCEHIKSYGYSS